MYRWVDERGQVHYSDRVPQEYVDKERKEYDEDGRLLSTIDAAKTKTQLAEVKKQAAEEAQRLKQAEEQEKADRVLLKTYATTKELEKAREEQLALIELTIESLQDKIKGLKERRSNGKQDEAVAQGGQDSVPDDETKKPRQDSELSEIQQQLEMQRKKKNEIANRFDSYMQRFAELNR
jgi:hypothetical protein